MPATALRELPLDEYGREVRSVTKGVFRDAEADVMPQFGGHAAVFNRRTWIGPPRQGFWEQVAPGAFERSLREADVRFLYNHDADALLATSSNGSLRLREDQQGLLTEADLPPDDIDVQRILPKLRDGRLRHMSFAFQAVDDSWELAEGGTEMRTLNEVKLYDVSVVTFPAYPDTDAAIRSQAFSIYFRSLGIDAERQRTLVRQIVDGVPVAEIPDLSNLRPEPGSSTRDEEDQPGSSTGDASHEARLRFTERARRQVASLERKSA